jgi:hypothetical protein
LLVPFVGVAGLVARWHPSRSMCLTGQRKIYRRAYPRFLGVSGRPAGVKALLVGLALCHIKGLRTSNTFIVSNLMLEAGDIQPDAKSRALRKRELAGLIKVERRGKRSPQVTLVV